MSSFHSLSVRVWFWYLWILSWIWFGRNDFILLHFSNWSQHKGSHKITFNRKATLFSTKKKWRQLNERGFHIEKMALDFLIPKHYSFILLVIRDHTAPHSFIVKIAPKSTAIRVEKSLSCTEKDGCNTIDRATRMQ